MSHVSHVIQQTCSIINSHLHLQFKKKKIKRLVLSPQLRAVVYLLFGLLAEKVAGVKWQIADPGHGNILVSSCGNIGFSSCGNIGPTTTFQAYSDMLCPK